MAEKTPGRKKASSKKTAKPPIPIDGGASAVAPVPVMVGGERDNAASNEGFPGIQEEIRQRAYELYEARGRQEGLQEEDWIHAETEILAKYRAKSA